MKVPTNSEDTHKLWDQQFHLYYTPIGSVIVFTKRHILDIHSNTICNSHSESHQQ